MKGKDAMPLCAGWTPVSSTIVMSRYCSTQQDLPTSCPAPSMVMLSEGVSAMMAEDKEARETTRRARRTSTGRACDLFLLAAMSEAKKASRASATATHANGRSKAKEGAKKSMKRAMARGKVAQAREALDLEFMALREVRSLPPAC